MRIPALLYGSLCRTTLASLALIALQTADAVPVNGEYRVIAANDLGMHCADLDYKIFSILPPFNVVHAQVIRKGNASQLPALLDNTSANVFYSAASSPVDPVAPNSMNTTSANLPGIFKTNFWQQTRRNVSLPGSTEKLTLGGFGYGTLYPSVLAAALLDPPADLSAACLKPNAVSPAASHGCPSILQVFDSIPVDTGLPVPDLEALAGGVLAVGIQEMPGLSNNPQPISHFVPEQPFFTAFPFGQVVPDANWFAAEGIPLLPVDDMGNSNAYPLMQIAAHDPADGQKLASLDIVLPVASEADCQNCHADPDDAGNGAATTFASTPFNIVKAVDAPGPQKLQNAAKLNILRLHDAKHGMDYQYWNVGGKLIDRACDSAVDPEKWTCLARQQKIQCSQCHYSPALDLAHVGPVDEPAQGARGRQQTRHVSMSSAMHRHHGTLPDFMGEPLFPDMPAPDDPLRTASQLSTPVNALERDILNKTCYQCHPGKQTQCLRGAMASAGVLCQDCHGGMQEVGNDFSVKVAHNNVGDFVLDGSLRVPWASEPGCQSCHTGDAVQPNHPPGAIVADDGIRLLRAYEPGIVTVAGLGDLPVSNMHKSPASPFAENQGTNANGDTVDTLYRLSTGHGGVKCEGCHNSTHAIWPVANSFANDNVASMQLQGHVGTLSDCTTCHGDDSFNVETDFRDNLGADGKMKGPHGMHPVADRAWNLEHKEVDRASGRATCRSCHGAEGQGSVLSRVATDRNFICDESNFPGCQETSQGKRIAMPKGTEVSCGQCHENVLAAGWTDDD